MQDRPADMLQHSQVQAFFCGLDQGGEKLINHHMYDLVQLECPRIQFDVEHCSPQMLISSGMATD